MTTKMEKPEFVTEEHLEYLDELRESGVTNMIGSASYVQEEFPELDKNQSMQVVSYWMETFEDRHTD